MRRLLLFLFLAVLPVAGHSEIAWAKSYSIGVQLARKQNKPILLFVRGAGAQPPLLARTLSSPAVQKRLGRFVCVEVLGSDSKAKALGASAPSFYFLNSSGRVLSRVVGVLNPDSFQLEIDRAEDNLRDWPSVLLGLRRNKNDPAANARHASLLANRGKRTAAEAAIKTALAAGYGGSELSRAYNAIGDEYQLTSKFDQGIRWFLKAEKAKGRPVDYAYALVSLMSCHLQKGDAPGALPYAKKLARDRKAPKTYVDFANQVITASKQPE